MKLHIKGWKINPHICGFSIDCRESFDLIEKLSETGLPIMCCSGLGLPEDVLATGIPSGQTKKDVRNQSLDKYESVLDTFPDTTFILAHGGCFEFDKMAGLLKKHQNAYTDISIQPACNIKTLLKEIGSERILFGTDYPFVTQAFSILSVLRATQDEKERINELLILELATDEYMEQMIRNENDEVIGDMCFKGLSEEGMIEIGYGMKSSFEGQGYMTEAVIGIIEWASLRQDVKRIEAESEPDNIASHRVLEKAGFVKNGLMGEEGPRFVRINDENR